MSDPTQHSRPEEELAYIKYSAKEILFHLTSKVDALQSDVNKIKLDMVYMVSRQELTQTRRWAVGAGLAAVGTLLASLRLFI